MFCVFCVDFMKSEPILSRFGGFFGKLHFRHRTPPRGPLRAILGRGKSFDLGNYLPIRPHQIENLGPVEDPSQYGFSLMHISVNYLCPKSQKSQKR